MCRSRIGQTLLAAAALILITGFILSRLSTPHRESTIARSRFWALKTHGDQQVDMILIGDSRTYQGLSPRLMQTVLEDYRILNFAYSAGGLNPVMYREAEDRLDPESDMRAVVLGISPSNLLIISAGNDHFLEWKLKDPWEIFLALHLYPAYRFLYPIDLVEWVRPAEDTGYRVAYHDDGWVASWVEPGPDAPPTPELSLSGCNQAPPAEAPNGPAPTPKAPPGSPYRVSSVIVNALLDQTRAWTQQGIHVFALRLPTPASKIQAENELTGLSDWEFAQAFEAAGGVWFWMPPEAYPTLDGTHLGKHSAMQLSLDLAACIQEWLQEHESTR
ncbi:MAG: hypothetical protein PVJ07_02355 [Anaerolineales bacterium]|jgi:hypothetical protein